ncbi:FxSxx-COOH system tetratricopeptide repeat protein [Archangium lansingense]|uniref:FxSxx-COOH system tetratricopeptide repeat protein n=1 Tax=Archangium lansingense TaxID=2995310 RepID=UPI003B784F60
MRTVEPDEVEAEIAQVAGVSLSERSLELLPLLALSDRDFELFCYELLHGRREAGKADGIDAVRLLNEGKDRGRDLVLYRQQRVVGIVQCKRITSPLGLPMALQEIIKFLLFALVDPELMPEPNDFMYKLASAGPLTEAAGDFFHESTRILAANQEKIPIWTAKVLQDYASFKALDLPTAVRSVVERLPQLRYELLSDGELSRQASEFPALIRRFFKVATVVDSGVVDTKLATLAQAIDQLPERTSQVLARQQTRLAAPAVVGGGRALKNPMYSPSAAFTDRPALIEQLSDCMMRSGRAALVGLAGTGKTQLGLRYGQLHDAALDIIWWCDASASDGGLNDLLRLYDRLGLHPAVSDPVERSHILREALMRRERWLLVFDGAQQPTKAVIRSVIPPTGGSVLITSTMPNQWHDIAAELPVNAFKPSEAVSFIVRRSAHRLEQGAAILGRELEYLPLALELAVSFAVESDCSVSEYVELFRKYRFALFQKSDPPVDYGRTIQTAWSMSMARTRERSLAAAQLIGVCSFLASTGIRLAMLREAARWAPQPLRSVFEDQLQTRTLLRDAQAYSLVTVENETLHLHQLVQQFTRQEIKREPESFRQLLDTAAHSVGKSMPEVTHATKSALRELAPHALAIAEHLDSAEPVVSAGILNQVGLFVAEGGDFRKGQQLLLKAVERSAAAGVPAAGIELSVRANLSWLESEIGDLNEAEKWARWVLERQQEAMEPVPIAIACNNLSKVLEKRGKIHEAKEVLEQAIRVLQPLDSAAAEDMALISGNLAGLYLEEGKLKEAIELQRKVLKMRQKLYPDGHPDVALAMSELARSLIRDNNLDEAQALCEPALEMARVLNGPDHPETSRVMKTLAFLHLKRGNVRDAGELAFNADRIDQTVYGLEWDGRAGPLSILAQVQQMSGDAALALQTYLTALSLLEPKQEQHSLDLHKFVAKILSILPAAVTPDTLKHHLRLFSTLSVSSPLRPVLAKRLVNRICPYLQEQNRLDEANEVARSARRWLAEEGETNSDAYAAIVAAGAAIASGLNQFDAAEEGLREAVRIWGRISPGSVDWAAATIALGVALSHQGKLDEAVAHLESVTEQADAPNEWRLIAQFELGITLLLGKRFPDAERRLLAVLDSGCNLAESAALALRELYANTGNTEELKRMDTRLAKMRAIGG